MLCGDARVSFSYPRPRSHQGSGGIEENGFDRHDFTPSWKMDSELRKIPFVLRKEFD